MNLVAFVWVGSVALTAVFALRRQKRERDLALVYTLLSSISPRSVPCWWIREHSSFRLGFYVQGLLDELLLRGLVVVTAGTPCGYRVAGGEGNDDDGGPTE